MLNTCVRRMCGKINKITRRKRTGYWNPKNDFRLLARGLLGFNYTPTTEMLREKKQLETKFLC